MVIGGSSQVDTSIAGMMTLTSGVNIIKIV